MSDDIQTIVKRAMQRQDSSDNSSNDYDTKDSSKSQNIQVFVFICVLILLIWGAQAELDITVDTRGEIVHEFDIEKIQHLEGGMLDEIYIKEGDHVYIGQKIARIKAKERVSELDTINLEIMGFEIEIERFNALINEREPDFSKHTINADLVKTAIRNWEKERAKNTSNDSIITHDLIHKKRLISSMKYRLESAHKQLKLIQSQLIIKEQLYTDEVASYVDVLNMRVQEMNMLREIENLDEAILNENFQLIKLDKQLADSKHNRNAEYLKSIYDQKKQLDIKTTHMPRVVDKVDRMIIYSPIEGTVDKVHFNYKSAVISPGESIADISPIRGQLIAEAKIPRKNIGFVEVGQKAAIKIDTYAFTKYGAINGTIASISRESYEEKEEEYYFAKIALEKNYLERGGVRHYISQSMEFTANITTGNRRIIEYAIKPITDAIEESFDER